MAVNKKRCYNIFWDAENTSIYKVANPEEDGSYMTFKEAKKELRRFAASMVYRYSKLKSSAFHLKETDLK